MLCPDKRGAVITAVGACHKLYIFAVAVLDIREDGNVGILSPGGCLCVGDVDALAPSVSRGAVLSVAVDESGIM